MISTRDKIPPEFYPGKLYNLGISPEVLVWVNPEIQEVLATFLLPPVTGGAPSPVEGLSGMLGRSH